MLQKLYAIVSSSCCADNPDSPQHQEVLLPGSLYGMIIKERLEELLNNIRSAISADVRNKVVVDFNDSACTTTDIVAMVSDSIYRALLCKNLEPGEL